jgi:hypothetical protein
MGVLTLQKADRDAVKQFKLMRWHHFICKQLPTCQQISAESAHGRQGPQDLSRVSKTPPIGSVCSGVSISGSVAVLKPGRFSASWLF